GTFFQSFWSETPDVDEMRKWEAATRLGGEVTDGRVAGDLVLVIRGSLLRRFPGTVIYAVRATATGGLSTTELHPLHRGELGADAVFLLFRLTRAQALGGTAGDGGPGWYFVLQEQPTEPRFGLNEPGGPETPETWGQLAWDHVATSPGGYLRVEDSAAGLGSVVEQNGPAWGFNGAHMAQITLQQPFRIAIHARRLL
ncbi:MAG TPA: hypothetical protein VEQ60_07040, partial [Longimicrobium sp.]|nr:hypothetical protein [Longimicrobium sp.]